MRQEVQQVTFGSYETCPKCNHVHPKQQKGELIRINCEQCGESLLYFGKMETVSMEITVEEHVDGSATVRMEE